jgi:hypothetical protein
MTKYKFHYEVGDLVEFVEGRLGASLKRTGLIIDRVFNYNEDMYKIRSINEKDIWTSEGTITLLSKVMKGSCKC